MARTRIPGNVQARAAGVRDPDAKMPIRGRGKRTRAQLVKAAQRVFEQDGYLNARVADIAAAAGVAHGTFYTYFDSKEDVFREVVDEIVAEVEAALEAPVEGAVADRIQTYLRHYLEVYERHAAMLGLVEQVGTLPEFHGFRQELRGRSVARVERLIETLKPAERSAVTPLDAHVVAVALVGMMESFAYTWFVLKQPFDRQVAIDNLDGIWLRSLGAKRRPRRA